MFKNIKLSMAALPFVLAASAAGASAQGAIGTWIDHTGRGAVEISDCGGALCGKIVWLKSAGDEEACNLQIIGNVKPVSGGKYDGGWIYDPEKRAKYDVELTPQGDRLKVLGYMGTKFFGETMMWTRAPASLKRCGTPAASQPEAARPETPRPEAARPEPEAPIRKAEPAPERTPAPAPEPAPQREAKAKPGSPLFETREVGKGKECSIRLPELGKFSFPC